MPGLILERLALRLRPRVTITDPPREGIVVERDVAVPMRDGVRLRVDVYRPAGGHPVPVLLCAHPYGKENLPPRRRHGFGIPRQYRILPQSQAFSHSAWTGWEGPDPAHWVPRGYAVVNADLRGWGTSEGVGELLSAQEGRDGHDLVEWAAAQPWSTGRVGMTGVSYLAISQWATATERPPHLAAICPWEGFTDAYRDFARPGGLREDGFFVVWTTMLKALRRSPVTLRAEQKRRPLRDGWWTARDRNLEKIDTPALVCGSFSDHCLHSRGSFEGFRRISSEHKWLYTHRGPKWATYYSSPDALALQERFFGHFLRGEDNGMPDEPRVRLEVREDADTVTAVRSVADWPPPDAVWRDLHLDVDRSTLDEGPVTRASQRTWSMRRDRVSFSRVLDVDTEVVGPMAVRLWVSLPAGGDVALVVGIAKERGGRQVGFEGSYGFRGDVVTHGMLKASHRRLDTEAGRGLPVAAHTDARPLSPGEVVPVDVELLPSSTLFRAGEVLRLDVQGRWLFPRNPLTGQFPAGYQRGPRGTCVLHTGGEHPSILRMPELPGRADLAEDA